MDENIKSGKASLREKARPSIHCECGFEILLVSDLRAMGSAIDTHAKEHGKKEKDPEKAAFEEERITAILIAQAFNAGTSL